MPPTHTQTQSSPAASQIPVYAWERFWCPLGSEYADVEGGYLADPGGEYSKYFVPSAVPFATIESYRCLVLLGEPGMGKSSELRRHLATPERRTGSMLVDLREFEDMSDLRSGVFESDQIQSWKTGHGQLSLIFDSLDEALFDIRVLVSRLPRELSLLPIDRLTLRIACRTADWPTALENGLRELFGPDRVGVYEILPLRRRDVELAAHENGVAAESFLAKIATQQIQPLAAKPTTLKFLLDLFAARGEFPSTQAALYGEGCLHLCRELDPERRESHRAGQLTAEQRLVIAERIAAATIFGNRAAVWIGQDGPQIPNTDVSVASLAGGVEIAQGLRLEVTEAAVREVVSTGLFSGRGPSRMGWAHQTYGEFLAARWAASRNLNRTQLQSLICHPQDPSRYLIPQLHPTVSRMAGLSGQVMTLAIQTEPEVLLHGDVRFEDDAQRKAVVQALLNRADAGVAARPEFGARVRYDRLSHQGLPVQLHRYLSDSSTPEPAREIAIEIAEACRVEQLGPDLADLALNPTEPIRLRVDAARAVASIAAFEVKGRLRPLIDNDIPDDETDDLRGSALFALWPSHLTADELFSALRRPKRGNYYGSLSAFLVQLAGTITPVIVIQGLRWIPTLRHAGNDSRREVERAILRAAWDQLEDDVVRDLFATEVYDRLQRHEELLEDDRGGQLEELVRSNAEKRRALVSALVAKAKEPNDLGYRLALSRPPLLLPEDFSWLVNRTLEASDSQAAIWSELVPTMADPRDPDHLAILYEHRDHPLLRQIVRRFLGPIPLDSPEAEQSRQIHEFRRSSMSRPAEETPPSIEARAESILSSREENPASTWVAFVQLLKDLGRTVHSDGWADEKVLAGWKTVDVASRQVALDLATAFVQTQVEQARDWYTPEGHTWGADAAFYALLILEIESPERLAALTPEAWEVWAPIIVGLGSSHSEDTDSPGVTLLRRVYEMVPVATISAFTALFRSESERYNGLPSLRRLRSVLDTRMGTALLGLVQDSGIAANARETILEELLTYGSEGALTLAQSWISTIEEDTTSSSKEFIAGQALLRVMPERGWPLLWPLIRDNENFGRELLLSVAYKMVSERSRFVTALSEDALADFFAWTVKKFPYPDPHYEGVYSPTREDELRHWRDIVITALRDRGTWEAVTGLQRLALVTELPWLRDTALRAERKFREESWRPPSPELIIRMPSDPELRLVDSPAQLMDVLVESLERFQEELQGEHRAAPELWNDSPYQPKDENALTDKIARHLRQDLRGRGTVANREVVIRRGDRHGRPGQRTDIYIDAIRRDHYGNIDTVTVILESKGSWHEEVLTAMEEQLLPYLENNQQCHSGLYVVGWYLCERWIEEPRKARTRRLGSLSNFRNRLIEQASQLNRPGILLRSLVLDTAWY